jgi:toxin secretion/phage lysis holin
VIVLKLDNVFKSLMVAAGGLVGYVWGGWFALLEALVWFVVIDYVSGWIAAGIQGTLSSSIGFKGIGKKVLIFVMVAVGHKADEISGAGHMVRDAVICFYLWNELLSIIENFGRAGVPVPDVIQRAVAVLKGKEKESKT